MKELQPLYNYLSVRSVTASVGLGFLGFCCYFVRDFNHLRSGFRIRIRMFLPCPDPDPDPHKFADPGKKVRK